MSKFGGVLIEEEDSTQVTSKFGGVPTEERQDLDQEQEDVDAISFLNKAILSVPGGAVDLVAAGLDRAGSDLRRGARGVSDFLGIENPPIPKEEDVPKFSDNPVGGSQMIRELMAKVGAPLPDRSPQTTSEYVAEGVGEALGFAAGGLGLASRANMAKKATDPRILNYIKGSADDIYKSFVRSPRKMVSAEVAAGAGVGIARQIADESNYTSTEKFLAELAGGVLGVGAVSIGGPVKQFGNLLKKAADDIRFMFSKDGTFERASRRMRSIAENPELAVREIEALKGNNLLPSAKTNDPGLAALTRTVLNKEPATKTRVSKHYAKAEESLIKEIQKSGKSKSAREFLEAKKKRLFAALDARVEKASDEIVKAFGSKNVGDAVTMSNLQIAAREGLESALADAKIQEALLWKAVPMEAKTRLTNFSQKFEQLWSTVPLAQRKSIPQDAKDFFRFLSDKNVKALKFSELDGLYKQLGQVARNARAGDQPDRFMASMAEDLRDAILQDMSNPIGSKKAKEAVQFARAYSLELNKKFRRGSVGKILGLGRAGESKINPERTLEIGVGRPGASGKIAAKEVRDAVTSIDKPATNLQTMGAVQDFIKGRFVKSAFNDNGDFNARAAEAFMRSNDQILDFFPNLRDQFRAARSLEDAARSTKTWVEAFKKKYDSPSVSYASKYLNSPVDREIEAIMNSKVPYPNEIIRELLKRVNQSVKNPRDKAKIMEGFRRSASEWLIKKYTDHSKTDMLGELQVRGLAMKATLKHPEIREAFKLLNTHDSFKRLENIVNQFARIESAIKGKEKLNAIIADAPAVLIEFPVRYLATQGANNTANAFGNTGAGPGLQLAQMVSTLTKKLLYSLNLDKARQMIIDAQFDEELYKSLLLNPGRSTKPTIQRANKKLNSWLLGPGSRLLDEEDDQAN